MAGETDSELDWDISGSVAVLGIEIPAGIAVENARRAGRGDAVALLVEDEDVSGFGVEPLVGELGELVRDSKPAIEPEGVAGVVVDDLVGGVLIAAVIVVAVRASRRYGEVSDLVVVAAAGYEVAAKGA